MKPHYLASILLLLTTTAIGSESTTDMSKTTTGAVITNMTATATQGVGSFDGVIDEQSDLDALLATAWGESWLGLHRGHSPIKNVLTAFLGINHEEMHVYMEQDKLNLAGVCEKLGFDPDKLIESLTNSFMPFIEEGVAKSVIRKDEVAVWRQKLRDTFKKRVHWEG